jgi:hypothetical protein
MGLCSPPHILLAGLRQDYARLQLADFNEPGLRLASGACSMVFVSFLRNKALPGGLLFLAALLTGCIGTQGPDTNAPWVLAVSPADNATNVPINSVVTVTFSEAMDANSVDTRSFSVQGVTGVVSLNAEHTVATFTPSGLLAKNTLFTATATSAVKDLAGNGLVSSKVWTFTTGSNAPASAAALLGNAAPLGVLSGVPGMTNTGINTVVNGDMATTATQTSSISGFHDSSGDVYTETGANVGDVTGLIYSCTTPTTGGPFNSTACTTATNALLDAQAAYGALVALAPLAASPDPGAGLAGKTLLPGVYKSPSGAYLLQGGDLTLDAQGDANATWVFQMATTLTVGGPGNAFPQSIILAGGAVAKNVFWQVGSAATINAGGGGTMVGTIISQTGAAFSTLGNVTPVTLQGRMLSLGASVTLVNTVITVPP